MTTQIKELEETIRNLEEKVETLEYALRSRESELVKLTADLIGERQKNEALLDKYDVIIPAHVLKKLITAETHFNLLEKAYSLGSEYVALDLLFNTTGKEKRKC